MDQLNLMQVFVVVAEEQGFAAASRRLKMSPPTVTRAIAALETLLSVKLLRRTTRHVRMTDAGERYLEDVKQILQQVQMANEAAIGINSTPQGSISITAPVLFGQQFILPSVVSYLSTYPKTQVNAVFLDRVVNLLEEGFDIGVRIGTLTDSSMRARKVGAVRLCLVASPDYLSSYGIPQTFSDLSNHTLIATNTGSINPDWHFLSKEKQHSLRIKPRLTVTTNQAAINAAKAGLGIARVISYQIADELVNNELKTILEPFEFPAMPINIVHREDRLSSNKVRSFIDLLAEDLQQNSAIN